MKRSKLLIIAIATLLAAGCASNGAVERDGNKVTVDIAAVYKAAADIAKQRREYCATYGDSAVCKLALDAIRAELPLVPEDGICTALLGDMENIAGELVKQQIKTPE